MSWFSASFSAAAFPTSPTSRTSLPRHERSGSSRSSCPAVPPTITWSVPESAWGMLPRTGASTHSPPAAATSTAKARLSSGPMVPIWTTVRPATAARASGAKSTARIAGASASIRIVTGEASRASAAVDADVQTRLAERRRLRGRPVPDRHGEAGRGEAEGDRRAEEAGAEKGNVAHPPILRPARIIGNPPSAAHDPPREELR